MPENEPKEKEKRERKTIDFTDVTPLKWPDAMGRTLIQERKTNKAWKKQWSYYVKVVTEELQRFGAAAVMITRNPPSDERFDPGVAVWFSIKRTDDFSWQKGLEIDSPKPTIEEIDRQFKKLSSKHHPDSVANNSGGDVQQFLKLGNYRKMAKAWVLGESPDNLENCMSRDAYTDARQNLAAIYMSLKHLRALENLGNPMIVERIMQRSFRAALTAQASTQEVA